VAIGSGMERKYKFEFENYDAFLRVLDGGRIVGCGTHSDLLRGCETYREIALSQLSAAELGQEG
jgi:hypothetical protein